jgi:hypothetical protein
MTPPSFEQFTISLKTPVGEVSTAVGRADELCSGRFDRAAGAETGRRSGRTGRSTDARHGDAFLAKKDVRRAAVCWCPSRRRKHLRSER